MEGGMMGSLGLPHGCAGRMVPVFCIVEFGMDKFIWKSSWAIHFGVEMLASANEFWASGWRLFNIAARDDALFSHRRAWTVK